MTLAGLSRRYRIGDLGVPVTVERGGGIAHDRTHHREIQVDEVHFVVGAEILVAEVAPTDDRDPVVGNPGLVVHAVIEPLRVAQEVEHERHRAGARRQRIEHPNVDVRVCVERRDPVVLGSGIHVVHEQAHLHAAVRRLQQDVGQRKTCRVTVPDVGLHIDAAAGHLRRQRTNREALGPVADEPEARLPRMTLLLRRSEAVELCTGAGRYRRLTGAAKDGAAAARNQRPAAAVQAMQRGSAPRMARDSLVPACDLMRALLLVEACVH